MAFYFGFAHPQSACVHYRRIMHYNWPITACVISATNTSHIVNNNMEQSTFHLRVKIKTAHICFGFALLCLAIRLKKNLCHFVAQSEVKTIHLIHLHTFASLQVHLMEGIGRLHEFFCGCGESVWFFFLCFLDIFFSKSLTPTPPQMVQL